MLNVNLKEVVLMLDERQVKCAEMLAIGIGKAEIATIVGISRTTLWSWEKLKEFQAKLDEFEQEISFQSKRILKGALINASKVLVEQLKSKNEKIAQGAATDILDRGHGKATSRMELADGREDKDTVTADILDQELKEFDKEQ
ncbi:phBC6A51 family helix-turn-helix protein [Clostridium lacusfryxellense]|uniref:phBC6A51 family helix-turn-helix protein n=1 Tax=Clostridium lacusfryxellense TaxID=205328 RepID=UPI001C0B441F|nr:phBC6A51 family helix-turn-helix protein [Clostridium lacusfryxellense]MBU3111989.1 hypothetical protein [Clostridium lacusfryxellense]